MSEIPASDLYVPMRFLLVALCLTVSASAQSPLFPDGTSMTRAASHWRVAAGGGFADGVGTAMGSLGAERSVAGPFAVGGGVVVYAGPGFQDDGASYEGLSLDAHASVGTRDRVLDLRALAGVGVGVVNYDPGFCFGDIATCPEPEASGPLPSPMVFVGAGLDLYVTAGVGLGAELRLAPTVDEINLSTFEAGLRVRLAR